MATSSPSAQRARRVVRKTVTFTGAAGLGAVGSVAGLTTVGTVLVQSLNIHCVTGLTSSGGTISLGISGDTAALIQVTTASNILAGYQWTDTQPGKIGEILGPFTISDSLIFTVASAAISAGVVEIEVIFDALSADGNLY